MHALVCLLIIYLYCFMANIPRVCKQLVLAAQNTNIVTINLQLLTCKEEQTSSCSSIVVSPVLQEMDNAWIIV